MSKLAEYAELAKNIILMICAFLIVFFVFGALNINRKYFIYVSVVLTSFIFLVGLYSISEARKNFKKRAPFILKFFIIAFLLFSAVFYFCRDIFSGMPNFLMMTIVGAISVVITYITYAISDSVNLMKNKEEN